MPISNYIDMFVVKRISIWLLIIAWTLAIAFTTWVVVVVCAIVLSPGPLFAPIPTTGAITSGSDGSPTKCYWTGTNLRPKEASPFPTSAKSFWCYDGGNVFGSIFYGTFECDNREDCLKAVEVLMGHPPDEMKPWVPSKYAVAMEGPGFYSTTAKNSPWNVREIKNGLVSEYVQEPHERMEYYAIDFDRNRVYYHYDSGGFPADGYPASAGKVKAQAKSP